MKLSPIADRIAADVYTRPINPWVRTSAIVQDAVDRATGLELSLSVRNRLCEMVELRLRNSMKPGGLHATHIAHGHPAGRGGGTSYDFPGGPDCAHKEQG